MKRIADSQTSSDAMRTGTRTAARAHTLTQMLAAPVELLTASAFARKRAFAAT